MSILTFLAYDLRGECILEADEETHHSPCKLALDMRDRIEDCSRVVVLSDGKFAFDTNDMRD